MKKSFILYTDMLDCLDGMEDSAVADLFRMIKAYQNNTIDQLDQPHPVALAIFPIFRNQFDRDHEKWEKTREVRRIAGKAGGLAKAKNMEESKQMLANASKTKQSLANSSKDLANLAVNVTVTDNVNDINKPKSEGDAKRPRVPYSSIIDLYHEILPNNPRVSALSENRKRQIKARWNNGVGELDDWKRYFELVADSKFLTGQCPPGGGRTKPFMANIDFLINEANILKIVEGKYE